VPEVVGADPCRQSLVIDQGGPTHTRIQRSNTTRSITGLRPGSRSE
jgi:hypothetical protein